MSQVLVLTVKDLKLLLRDRAGFFFTFFFPLIYAVFFGSIFSGQSGGGEGIPIAVVDEDATTESGAFIDMLDEAPEVSVIRSTRTEALDLVRKGKRTAFVLLVKGFGEARERMFWGDPARIEIGVDPSRAADAGMLQGIMTGYAMKGFQEIFSDPKAMQEKTRRAMADIAKNPSIQPAMRTTFERFFGELDTFMDQVSTPDTSDGDDGGGGGDDGWPIASAVGDAKKSRKSKVESRKRGGCPIASAVGDAKKSRKSKVESRKRGGWPIASAVGDTNNGGSDGDDGDGDGGWQPVVIEMTDVAYQSSGPKNAFEISFPQAIVWGVLGCAAAFGVSMVVERTHGTLVRLRMSPIARWQILAGKAGACFVTTVAMMTVLMAFGIFVFGVKPHSFVLLALAFVSVALCFVGIMMLLSVAGKTERSAGGVGWAILLVMAMVGGGMIPLMFMPSWMQTASHISPVKWAILAMEGAIWRGFSPVEMIQPCGILVAFGAVFFAIGVRAFRWSQE